MGIALITQCKLRFRAVGLIEDSWGEIESEKCAGKKELYNYSMLGNND